MPETQLTSVGPRVSPIKDTLVCAASRKTEAWGDDKTTGSLNAAASPRVRIHSVGVDEKETAAEHRRLPRPHAGALGDTCSREEYRDGVLPEYEAKRSSHTVAQELEESGTFDIDRIYKLVSLDDFAVISQYYALILQSSEFPGATFTPRSFSPSSENEKLSILLRDSAATATEPRDIPIDLVCSSENAFLKATKCTHPDGSPCPAEYLQDNETRTYGDIDLHEISANSGLENNIGLLYMVDFIHQAMSALFAAQDWSAALEDLNYVQEIEKALEAGGLSSYKDNTPYIYDRDAGCPIGLVEADLSTAPFRVFDKYLKISSTAKVAPVDDNINTRCHRALLKVIGKIAYLALVGLSKPTSYLMFMAEVPIEHRTWLLHQVYRKELIGESFFGDRVAFPYRNGPYTRKNDGSVWVVVPLLQAMVKYYGSDQTLASIRTELDRSFPDFVKTSNGDIQFPDAAYCHIDGLSLSTQVTAAGDTAKAMYEKLAPGIEAGLTDLLALLPNLVTQMNAAMAAMNTSPITLSRDQILGSPVITADTEGLGPPNDWKPSAFMAGMLKFWPPKTPLDETVQQLRASTRCYRMLDLQFMKKATRCFAEPRNVRVSWRAVNSERMREFFLSNWSMAVILNTMAWVVVLKYLEKLRNAWRVTKFECLDVEVALQLNLQGMGVLSITQSIASRRNFAVAHQFPHRK
ncbi:hypothetical protein FI667_g11149, partial [Globisporangium splendens]